MSEEELDLSYELLELISAKVGAENLRNFLRDFADYCNAILPDDSDEDYVEVIDSLSEQSEEDEETEIVDEEYTTEVDEEGFYSLKECEVDNQK